MAIVARRAHTPDGGSSRLKRVAFPVLTLAGMVGLSLLASACGGSSGAKVARIGTTSSGKSPASSSDTGTGDARAYSACMRSHGVPNFPDPDENGRLLVKGGVDGMNTPQGRKAAQACAHLQPNGGRPTAAQEAKDLQAFLTYARCMRSHGVPRFPDPKPGGGLQIGPKVGVNPSTPQFQAAQAACRKVVPGIPSAAPSAFAAVVRKRLPLRVWLIRSPRRSLVLDLGGRPARLRPDSVLFRPEGLSVASSSLQRRPRVEPPEKVKQGGSERSAAAHRGGGGEPGGAARRTRGPCASAQRICDPSAAEAKRWIVCGAERTQMPATASEE
jgi:hypothetical protein